jgi:hypothetical protein
VEMKWTKEIPVQRGTYWVKGVEDPDESAVRVRIVTRTTEPDMPFESVMVGLSWLRVFDVVGDGLEFEEFERRPLFELEGALWSKVKP